MTFGVFPRQWPFFWNFRRIESLAWLLMVWWSLEDSREPKMMQIQIYETGICEDCSCCGFSMEYFKDHWGVYTIFWGGGGSKKINANVYDVWYCNFDGFPMVPWIPLNSAWSLGWCHIFKLTTCIWGNFSCFPVTSTRLVKLNQVEDESLWSQNNLVEVES